MAVVFQVVVRRSINEAVFSFWGPNLWILRIRPVCAKNFCNDLASCKMLRKARYICIAHEIVVLCTI